MNMQLFLLPACPLFSVCGKHGNGVGRILASFSNTVPLCSLTIPMKMVITKSS